MRWPSGRASDSGARGRGFDPHSGRRVVSLSKIHLPSKSTGNNNEKFRSFKSKENIHKKKVGPYHGFGY